MKQKKYEIEIAKKQSMNKVPVFFVKTIVTQPTGRKITIYRNTILN